MPDTMRAMRLSGLELSECIEEITELGCVWSAAQMLEIDMTLHTAVWLWNVLVNDMFVGLVGQILFLGYEHLRPLWWRLREG